MLCRKSVKRQPESNREIAAMIKDADLPFAICDMGGGTGTGAAPVVSGLARAC